MSPASSAPSFRALALTFGSVFLLALIPRLWGIGMKPVWLDETFTLHRAGLPLAGLIHDSFINHHLPTYFLLIHELMAFSPNIGLLRAPSAIFGALAVALTWLAARNIAGRMAGIAAALILGLAPSAIAFSQEARSYTMVMAMILIALNGLILLASAPRRAAGAAPGQRAAWLAFVLGTIAAMDVLADGAPWWIIANVAFVPMILSVPGQRAALAWRWLAANLIIVVCTLPLYVTMDHAVHGHFIHSFGWVPALDAQRIWSAIAGTFLLRIADSVSFRLMHVGLPEALFGFTAIALPFLALLGAVRLRGQRALQILLLLGCLALPIALLLISISKPVLVPRYMLWSDAPFAILAGIGAAYAASSFGPRGRRALGVAASLLLIVNLLPYYSAQTKPRWDLAAKFLDTHVRQNDFIYLTDRGAIPILEQYLPQGAQGRVLAHVTGNLDHAEAAEAAGQRVWVVSGRAGQGLAKSWQEFASQLVPLGTPSSFNMAGNRIRILLYDPADVVGPTASNGN
jgi:uncharacterized membrane protein